MDVLVVLLIFIVAAGLWYVDVRRHPWRTCPRCGGERRLKGTVPRTHGDCKRCGSTGRVPRLGARNQ